MKTETPIFRPYTEEACQIRTPSREEELCADQEPTADFDYRVRDEYRETHDPLHDVVPAVPYELAATMPLKGIGGTP